MIQSFNCECQNDHKQLLSETFSPIRMKLQTLIIALFLISPALSAQKPVDGYYTGYVVNAQNDTIQGRILDDGNYVSPEKVTFQANGSDEEYSPTDILAFYINELDFLFESHTIDKNQDSNTLTPMDELSGEVIRDRNFLFTIAKTKEYGLYSYFEKSGQERLYYHNGQKIEELLVFKSYTFENGVKIPQQKNRFRIQLLGFFIGCDNLKKKINSAGYNRKALRDLFISYTKCMGDEVTYVPKGSALVFSLGASVGFGTVLSADQSRTVLLGGNSLIARAVHEGGSWFEAGLVLRASLSRNSRVGYKGELKFRSQNIETVWTRTLLVENVLGKVIYNYKNTGAVLNLLGDVSLSRWNSGFLFFEGGVSFSQSLSASVEMSNGVFVGGDQFTFTDETSDDISILDSEIGLILGFGAQIDKFVFSVRYARNLGDNIDKETGIGMTHSSLSLNAIYNFK